MKKCRRLLLGLGTVWGGTLLSNLIPAYGQANGMSQPDGRAGRDPRPELIVYEGVGVGELQLGDPTSKVEQVLGEADAGSEHHREYRRIGLYVQLSHDKVYHLIFHPSFPGILFSSELGIGDTLADVQRAYGPILERREVVDHNAWRLDRVLLVRRGGPQFKGGDASKLHYYDLGMYFYFDEHERIYRFGLSDRTEYALRPSRERLQSHAAPPGRPRRARDDGDRRRLEWNPPAWGVREGIGFGDARFGDAAARIEALLGPPDGGSEVDWRYRKLGLTVGFAQGRASSFFFREGRASGSYFTGSFPGKLVASGIGIGDHLKDVEAFYGAALGRQRVKSLSESTPSRVLSVCEGCPAYAFGEVARLHYRDLELYFDFDDTQRVTAFGLTGKPRGARWTAPANQLVGAIAPSFSLFTTQHQPVSDTSMGRYSASVVCFYMPNCPACNKALAALERISLEDEAHDVRFVAVAQRGHDQRSREDLFAEQLASGMTMELVIEDFDERRAGKVFRITSYPTVFVIASDRVIKAAIVGADDDFEASVRNGILSAVGVDD